MPSKNSSIVLSDIRNHFGQIVEQDKSHQLQLQQISELVAEREDALKGLVTGFEKFLKEYEKDHPKKPQWNKTLNAALKYIEDSK